MERASDEPQNKKQRLDAAAPQTSTLATEPMEVEEAGQTMQTTEDMEVEEAGQTLETTEDMEVEEAGQTLEAMGLVKAMDVMKINESMNAMQAMVTHQLIDLLRQVWGPEQDQAFTKVKQKLNEALVQGQETNSGQLRCLHFIFTP